MYRESKKMAKPQTERTKNYFQKMRRLNLVIDPELESGLVKLKKEFGSINKGMQELLKKYMQKD
jgi:flagellar biosynthesis/type III secretory pathway protein FliH